ncbi:Aldo/keto reductase [Dichomitus squalens]|uniref:Aldo/keto reductase n=2 Tax=Dichomitus squalens TaxID=114155 RepID=A0A4Q9MMU3_9APHY|nr:Aldo/keto reductase [Dichomitus squalens]
MPGAILKRTIGDKTFPAIGYGAMGIAAAYGTPLTIEEALKVLDGVYASGVTHWDTADAYSNSEYIIGQWFKRTGKRDEIFLATKFGFGHHWEGDETRTINGDPDYVPKAVQRSLEQLGVDYVDLLYLHRADAKVPIELSVKAMAEQVKAGKVRYLGLSEVSADTLRRAYAIHPIAAVQVEYSPFTTEIEDEKIGLLKAARELGVRIVAYGALGRGLLTGKYTDPDQFPPTDFRRTIPRFSKENFPSILKIAEGLKKVGEKHGASSGQVALAWVLAQGEDIIPIVGTTKFDNLKENLGAYDVKLSPGDVAEVRRLADGASVPGDRYPARLFHTLFADTPALQQ